jgi:type IV pilus assembly protein PilF
MAGRASARLVLALCTAAALAACAGSGGGGRGPTAELKTASDQTFDEKRANIRMQLAVGYFQDGKYEVALDEIKQAIAANPNLAEAYGMRALIYTQMNEIPLADENFQRALRLAPRNPEISNNYGSFLCQNGRAAQALTLFDEALRSPTYASPLNALLNASSCSMKTKNYQAAERYLVDALRIAPDHPAANAGLARLYYDRRDMARAGFYNARLKEVAKLDSMTADQLWLAIRIDRKMADKSSEASMVSQLRRRFPASPELAAYQRGGFDE